MKTEPSERPLLTGSVVLGFFENHRKPWPSIAICDAIARRIDGPPSEEWLRYEEWLRNEAKINIENDKIDDLPIWDFAEIGRCASKLLDHMPLIIANWEGMVPNDHIVNIQNELKNLSKSLENSIEYIVYPWGKYKKINKKCPKDWHLLAVVYAHIIVEECKNGEYYIIYSLHKNSVFVKIIYDILKFVGLKGMQHGAISQHLLRFFVHAGSPFDHKSASGDL